MAYHGCPPKIAILCGSQINSFFFFFGWIKAWQSDCLSATLALVNLFFLQREHRQNLEG